MNPIASPFFIYFLSFINNILQMCYFFFVVSSIALFVYMVGYGINKGGGEYYEDDLKKWAVGWKFILKFLIIAWSISFLVATFCPNKNTLIGMYVTKHLTYDTVEKAVTTGTNVKDELKKDVIDIIEALNNRKENTNENK